MALPHHVRVGEGAPALVFVHGFACGQSDWHAQLAHFGPKHACVACDLPGHGATPGGPEDCTIEAYGSDVLELLETLELPPAVLVGHSMGCRVVLEATRQAPERVIGLVLVDGSRIGTGDPATAERNAAQALTSDGYAAFARGMFEAMFLAGSDAALRQRVVERARRLPEAVGMALFPRMVGWDAGSMERTLGAVKAPVLAIQSSYLNEARVRVPLEKGGTTPWLDLLKRTVYGTRVEIVTGVGHFPQLEAPSDVNRLIEAFVAEL